MPDNLPARRAQATVISSRHERYFEPKTGRTRAATGTRQNSNDSRIRQANRRQRNPSEYSPTRMAEKSTASVGLLEAEFLVSLLLLVMLMFANSSTSYSDKIMSLMKRGTLTCLLFFVLAMIASIGATATKVAQAFGALIVVAIMVTSPVGTVFTDLDNIIKNDWIGTGETGTDTTPSSGSSDTGTQQGQGGGSAALKAIEDQMSQWFLHLPAGDFSKLQGFLGGLFKKIHLLESH